MRDPGVSEVAELFTACRDEGALAWLGLYQPMHEELDEVARGFGLHELAVE